MPWPMLSASLPDLKLDLLLLVVTRDKESEFQGLLLVQPWIAVRCIVQAQIIIR